MRRRAAAQVEAVVGQEGQEVALVDHHQLHLGVELAQPADLGVLAGHQALVGGGQLDEAVVLGQPEVGPEARADGEPSSSQRSANSTGSYSQRMP